MTTLQAGARTQQEKRPIRAQLTGLLLVAPPIALLALLVAWPAVSAISFSLGLIPGNNLLFSQGLHLIRSDHPTFQVYKALWGQPAFRADLALTVGVALWSTLSICVLAYALALYTHFHRHRLATLLRSLYLVPMFVPVVIASYGLLLFFEGRGWLGSLIAQLGAPYRSPIFHQGGVVLGQVWQGIPFGVLLLGAGLEQIAPELLDAARDCGANIWTLLGRVILPLNWTGLLIVATFTFIGGMGSFTIPFLLGPNAPQLLAVEMNNYFGSFDQPQPAVAMAVLTFLIASLAGGLYVFATYRQRKL